MSVFGAGVRRLLQILRVAVRYGLAIALAPLLTGRRELADTHLGQIAAASGPDRLRGFFEDVGGTFIKFGQMLALQPDLVSIEYCNALFKLLDRVDPFPYSEVDRVVREELGQGPEDIFDSFETTPFASASVGQVHVAYLDGRKLAVKVQRPSVEVDFANDVRLMLLGIDLIRRLRLKPLYWMIEPASEFVGWTREELDYRHEARFAEALRRQAQDNPAQHIPAIYPEYCTRRTLVMEFLEGFTLLDYLRACEVGDEMLVRRIETTGFDRERFAAHVIDNFLGDVFRHGVYHADLHPANLMILPNNVVGYVDFGIIGIMSPYSRRHLVTMTLALASGDMVTLGLEYLKVTEHGPGSEPEVFCARLIAESDPWYPGDDSERFLSANFTQVMSDMLTMSRQTRVMPERDIIKYIRSSIGIDGLITRFAPKFEVGRHLAESCTRLILGQAFRNRFTADRLLDISNASAQLVKDGPKRATRLLDRLAAGELTAEARHDVDVERETVLSVRALVLAAAVLAMALVLARDPHSGLGLNLWTAELAFVIAAGASLLDTLRQMA